MRLDGLFYSSLLNLENIFKGGGKAVDVRLAVEETLLSFQTEFYSQFKEFKDSLNEEALAAHKGELEALEAHKKTLEEILHYLRDNAELLTSNYIISELNLKTAIDFINEKASFTSKFNVGKAAIIFIVFLFFVSFTTLLSRLTLWALMKFFVKHDSDRQTKGRIVEIIKRPMLLTLIAYAIDICVSIAYYPAPMPIKFANFLTITFVIAVTWLILSVLNGYGMVLGPDSRPFKTRDGGTVSLTSLLDLAEQEASPEIALAAIKYADLSGAIHKDYVFDAERMVQTTGDTGPYLQYAHARICQILRRAEAENISWGAVAVLEDPAEQTLALVLSRFGEVVDEVARALTPHKLCGYLYELAGAFSAFYEACPVLRSEGEVRSSRLALAAATREVLAQGLLVTPHFPQGDSHIVPAVRLLVLGALHLTEELQRLVPGSQGLLVVAQVPADRANTVQAVPLVLLAPLYLPEKLQRLLKSVKSLLKPTLPVQSASGVVGVTGPARDTLVDPLSLLDGGVHLAGKILVLAGLGPGVTPRPGGR